MSSFKVVGLIVTPTLHISDNCNSASGMKKVPERRCRAFPLKKGLAF